MAPTYTDEEILASTEAHAAHWEEQALREPEDVAFHCRDYAKHLRTIVECLRMDLLERGLQILGTGSQWRGGD
jgi:hypothetical protein